MRKKIKFNNLFQQKEIVIKRYNILILEESETIGKILKLTFEKNFFGSQIVLTNSLNRAKEIISNDKFDYVVLDIQLKDKSGTELIMHSKSITDVKSKFIIFTSLQSPELREKMYLLGALDYVMKTGNMKTVTEEMCTLIKKVDMHKFFTILVIDDAKMYRNIIRQHLENRNYRVLTAENGAEALEIASAKTVDLIITDMNMPIMNGEEFLIERRKRPELYKLPTIVLTGEKDNNIVSNLLKLGANDVLQKPFSIEEVLIKVDSYIELRNSHKENEALNKKLKRSIKEINRINNKLSKYLSPQLYKTIFSNNKQDIESKRKKLTIFMSDIKDFTATSEMMAPEDFIEILNQYLTEMAKIAIKYGGTIDKYIGDAILIFFGDPESKGVKEDAINCVSMALEMQRQMKKLQRYWFNKGIKHPFKVRVGITTGYCTVGNIGSEDRMDYTIIGREVNLASRIETSAKPDSVCISHETWALVKDVVKCQSLGEISAKGIAQPIPVYEVINFHDFDEKNKPVELDIEGCTLNFKPTDIKDEDKESVIQALKESLDRMLSNSTQSCKI